MVFFSSAAGALVSSSTGEVARQAVRVNTSTTAMTALSSERFFIFIMAPILSSIAFLPKALYSAPKPLRFSSISSRAIA